MPRPSKRKQYTEKKYRSVYVILNPFTKEFYIDYTLTPNLRKMYTEHYIETRRKTKKMVRQMKIENKRPCFFQLCNLFCTRVEAYRVVVGWTKIFVEQGYKNLDQGNVSKYIDDIFGEAKIIYEGNKKIDINREFNCNNCLFPTYKRRICELKARDTNATN